MIKAHHPHAEGMGSASVKRIFCHRPDFPQPSEKVKASVVLKTEIPGPRSRQLMKKRLKEVPASLFQMSPLFIEKAEGALVQDVDGNVLIDFAGGIGSLNTGHCHPDILAAMEAQMPAYLHTCFHVGMHEPYLLLAEKLNSIAPVAGPCKTALFNSGAEAVENAVKLARHFTGRPAIVAFEHAFHGRTLLGMSLTSKVHPYKAGFGPYAPEIYRLPYPVFYRRPREMSENGYLSFCLHQLHDFFKLQVKPEQVAAIILELQTGEGGFIPMPPLYLAALQSLCAQHGILIIADEVQSGFGRTGKMFACEHYGLKADLVTMAKSLGGGMPLGAVSGRADIMDSPDAGGIGSTFGGHPLSCVAALAAIEVLEKEKLCSRASYIGKVLTKGLRRLAETCPQIGDVRGLGAMVGVELVKDSVNHEPDPVLTKAVVRECLQQGLILLSCGVHGNVLRTLMPLTISDAQLLEALAILEKAFVKFCHEKTPRTSRSGRKHRTRDRLGLAPVLPAP